MYNSEKLPQLIVVLCNVFAYYFNVRYKKGFDGYN